MRIDEIVVGATYKAGKNSNPRTVLGLERGNLVEYQSRNISMHRITTIRAFAEWAKERIQ